MSTGFFEFMGVFLGMVILATLVIGVGMTLMLRWCDKHEFPPSSQSFEPDKFEVRAERNRRTIAARERFQRAWSRWKSRS